MWNRTAYPCETELPTLVEQNCLPLRNRTAYPCGTELPTLVEQNCLPLWNRTAYPCGTELPTLVEQNCLPCGTHEFTSGFCGIFLVFCVVF